MIHIYTSGTTGQPKGVVVPAFEPSPGSRPTWSSALGRHARTTCYWCAADPGWAYGLYFAILASLAWRHTEPAASTRQFAPGLTWQVLARFPGHQLRRRADRLPRATGEFGPVPPGLALRRASSAGEPLTPEVNEWAGDALGVAVHDHYGQTEAGMLVNNHHHPDLARSAASPGRWAGRCRAGGVIVLRDDADEAARAGHSGSDRGRRSRPARSRGSTATTNDPATSREKFSADGRWYLTGDAGRIDVDGDVYFSARDDDVIIMAGLPDRSVRGGVRAREPSGGRRVRRDRGA